MIRSRRSFVLLTAALLTAVTAAGTAAATTAPPTDTEPAGTEAAGTESAGSDAPAAAIGELEQTDLTIGLIPIADVAPVFIGLERGIFEDYGLNVTTEFAAGGAAAIPALQSGDIDLAFGGYPTGIAAVQAGLPILISSEAVRSGPLFAGLYSMPDSGIEEPADLAGATIAVNTLDNIVQMAVEAHLVDAGLSLDDVTLVEIGFPDMVAALETGNVDVIAVVEPFGTIARQTLDANLIVDMFSARLENFPVAGWFVTSDWAAEHPNTLAAFNAAFAEATDIAVNEEGALAAIVQTYTNATPELAAALNYPNMVAGLDVEYLQIVSDFMFEQGLIEEEVSVADMIIDNPPPSSVTDGASDGTAADTMAADTMAADTPASTVAG
jgi:NitT/TauT family transport system substrate-binding protein